MFGWIKEGTDREKHREREGETETERDRERERESEREREGTRAPTFNFDTISYTTLLTKAD